mmetsp:Transcript_19513/g.39498  ORF Transcript_19513/g.39498 Transcript_19513/m.39498 type:complete len:377 (+) Transcript_19513:3-1133(+)
MGQVLSCTERGRRLQEKEESDEDVRNNNQSGDKKKIRVIAELETGDPDDVLTLAWLAGHPRVDLIGVCMVPGTPEQVSICHQVLSRVLLNENKAADEKQKNDDDNNRANSSSVVLPPIAAVNPQHQTKSGKGGCVSPWHVKPKEKNGLGLKLTRRDPDMTPEQLYSLQPDVVITGSPPKGIAAAIRSWSSAHSDDKDIDEKSKKNKILPLWVCQGGFAGDSVVPEQHRLDKFKGKEMVPTYNLGGAMQDAEYLFSSSTLDHLTRIRMVAKNVCHGVVYDVAFHSKMQKIKNGNPGLEFIYDAMDRYLRKRPGGKKLHDPLAAVVALVPEVCSYAYVTPFRVKGKWGSRLEPKEGRIDIAVSYNRQVFEDAFMYGMP